MEPFGPKTVVHAGFGMFNEPARLPWIPHRPECSVQSGLQHSFIAGREFSHQSGCGACERETRPRGVQPDMRTPTLISWSLRIER